MIEEVLKILENYEEDNQYFRGILCTMYHPLAMEIYQLFKPDRPELGEKLHIILRLFSYYTLYDSDDFDQILALIDSAKKQIKGLSQLAQSSCLIREVEESRIEELFKEIEENYMISATLHPDMFPDGLVIFSQKQWQSLKDKWGVK